MAKLTLTDVTNITGNPTSAQTTINTNNDRVEAALEKTLSRDGTSPNQMNVNLDMNSKRIINLADAINPSDAVTLRQAAVLSGGGEIVIPTSLEDLDDVTITNVQATDILAYNGQNWYNASPQVGVWQQTPAELALSIVPSNFNFPPGHVNRYGAGSTATAAVNVTAIQTALNLATNSGGGAVFFSPSSIYNINASLILGSQTVVHGNGARLVQQTNNTPHFSFTKAPYNNGIVVRDLDFYFQSQQDSVAHPRGVAILLADADINSFRVLVENCTCKYGTSFWLLPEAVGCTAFLVEGKNLLADQCSGWGFDWLGAVAGARTNLNMTNCWVLNADGQEIATSKGFRIKRTHGISLDNCGCDHIQNGDCLFIESSQGNIGVFWAESCDITASSGISSYFNFSNADLDIGYLYSDTNTVTISGTANHYGVRAQAQANVRIKKLHDYAPTVVDTATGAYYAAGIDTSALLFVDEYNGSYTVYEPNLYPRIRFWDGESREEGLTTGTFSGITGISALSCRWVKNGNLVSLRFGGNTGGTGAGTTATLTGLPSDLKPDAIQACVGIGMLNDVYVPIKVEVGTNGTVLFTAGLDGGPFTAGQTAGIVSHTITYNTKS